MRKASLSAILILVLGAMMSTSIIRPAEAWIWTWNWLGQVHNYDPYWGAWQRVFPENTIATLQVTVNNPSGTIPLNISAVKVWLDWNINYSSTECSVSTPLVIQPLTSHTFTVTFTVPDTSTASNLVMHTYTIFVEEFNPTTGVSLHSSVWGSNFVVYSTIQKDAQRLYDELSVLVTLAPPWGFNSVEANMLWGNGTLEYLFGLSSHQSGDFNNAKARYETARGLLHQALSTETSFSKQMEDMQLLLLQAQVAEAQADARYREAQAKYYEAQATYQEAIANATMKQADAALMVANATMKQAEAELAIADAINMQSIALVLFGIGFIVFGFAAVVWAYRRPIPPV